MNIIRLYNGFVDPIFACIIIDILLSLISSIWDIGIARGNHSVGGRDNPRAAVQYPVSLF